MADGDFVTPAATPQTPTPSTSTWLAVIGRQPLSTVQTLVGILAGLLTIGGGFLSFTGLTSGVAWSSTASESNPYSAWVANRDFGIVHNADKTDGLGVWPVRGGSR